MDEFRASQRESRRSTTLTDRKRIGHFCVWQKESNWKWTRRMISMHPFEWERNGVCACVCVPAWVQMHACVLLSSEVERRLTLIERFKGRQGVRERDGWGREKRWGGQLSAIGGWWLEVKKINKKRERPHQTTRRERALEERSWLARERERDSITGENESVVFSILVERFRGRKRKRSHKLTGWKMWFKKKGRLYNLAYLQAQTT